MTNHDDAETSFGFRRVRREEKAGLVRGVFDRVADRYDLMNDFMSGGVHRLWKTVLLDRLSPQPGEILLDVAGGTGDIARGFLKRAGERRHAPDRDPARAIICDINHEMLKAGAAGDDSAVPLARVCGDAEKLPYRALPSTLTQLALASAMSPIWTPPSMRRGGSSGPVVSLRALSFLIRLRSYCKRPTTHIHLM